jgi:glycosyltransferase involved in cell wall biosynthesis
VQSLAPTDGGPARSVPSLAAAQAAEGADVRVWTQEIPTIDLSPFPGVGFVSGNLAYMLSGSWCPDILHDHGIWLRANNLSARVSRDRSLTRVISPRGMLEPWCLNHHRFRKRVAWKLYQHHDLKSASAFHATSDEEAQNIRSLGFEQPVIQLPNGVSMPLGAESISSKPGGRREVLFLSRIHPKKGLINLLEAWRRTAAPGWQLRIAGPADAVHLDQLKRFVDSAKLNRSVCFQDSIGESEKWDALHEASIVVLPSFSENFGIVVAEALAVGTPVITTTGTPWTKVREHRCGWYVEPTVDGIADGLAEAMATGATEFAEMGQRGVRWMEEEFGWPDIGRRMVTAYQELLGRQRETGLANRPQVQSASRAA